MYRAAMRRNCAEIMSAARMGFGALFYGMNMPNYQELDTRDWLMRVQVSLIVLASMENIVPLTPLKNAQIWNVLPQAPAEISNYLNENEMMSFSGIDGRAESVDFILEFQIQILVRLLPQGLPSDKHFTRAWRLYHILQGVSRNSRTIT